MLTDLDAMITMLKNANIEFRREDRASYPDYDDSDQKHPRTILIIERGYSGFVSQLIFTNSGELVSIEAYE